LRLALQQTFKPIEWLYQLSISNTIKLLTEKKILNEDSVKVYIIITESLEGWKNPMTEDGKTVLLKHYAWLAELKSNGKLLLAGPTDVELISTSKINPIGHITGVIMLNVKSREEAVELAFNDPFHLNGFRRNKVHSFKITITDNSLFEQLNRLTK
jgi:uncharacterized protein YciI